MHEVLVNRLGGLSLPRKSVVRLTDRPNMTLDVYCGRKTTIQQQAYNKNMTQVSRKYIKEYRIGLLCNSRTEEEYATSVETILNRT